MGMLTRKQQWRRIRTRNKRAWGDLPPEVLEAMLGGGANMSKSVSWDQSFAAALRERAEQSRAEAVRAATQAGRKDALDAAAAEAAAAGIGRAGGGSTPGAGVGTMNRGGGGIAEKHIPRSVSCSSLEARRTLFPRSASRDEFGESEKGAGAGGSARRRGSDGRRRVLRRRGVSFDTQVKMVLIPKKDEFNAAERARLWWSREDYACFRQVLIDWKRRNVHRISHSDNILSIDLAELDMDDEEEEQSNNSNANTHQDAVEADDATAAAAARAVQAQAQAAAEAAAQVQAQAQAADTASAAANLATEAAATAAAAAAAAAAATAAELATANARDEASAAVADSIGREPMEEEAQSLAAKVEEERRYGESWDDDEVAAASAGATLTHKLPHSDAHRSSNGAGGGELTLEDIAEEEPEEADGSSANSPAAAAEAATSKEAGGRRVLSRQFGSFRKAATIGGTGGPKTMPDWSLANKIDNGRFPLRRAFSEIGGDAIATTLPSNGNNTAARLKVVPLSDMQATVESLRAWRKTLDSRRFASAPSIYAKSSGGAGGPDGDEDGDGDERGRSLSLQGHNKGKRSGRATAKLDDLGDVGQGIAVCWSNGSYPHGGEGGSKDWVPNQAALPSVATPVGGGGDEAMGWDKKPGAAAGAGAAARSVATQVSMTAAGAFTPTMASPEKQRVTGDYFDASQGAGATIKHSPVPERASPDTAQLMKGASDGSAGTADNGDCRRGADETSTGGSGAQMEEVSHGVIELGLNDAPGSAAAAAAVGIRVAAEGVSNLSLRARDSVENLQEMAKQGWTNQMPLSSSA